MDATLDKDILLVAGTRGRFIFTDFYFSSDGMFSVAKILEMLACSGKEISEVVAEIPKRYLHSADVPCPWEKKGSVMRQSMEYSEGKERQLVDGVKVKLENGDTVLFLPDREDALFHVIAEADSKESAQQLCASHVAKVERWREA
jgi:mannose-1-phosphate guanylyltransferase/phosphomannomutase